MLAFRALQDQLVKGVPQSDDETCQAFGEAVGQTRDNGPIHRFSHCSGTDFNGAEDKEDSSRTSFWTIVSVNGAFSAPLERLNGHLLMLHVAGLVLLFLNVVL